MQRPTSGHSVNVNVASGKHDKRHVLLPHTHTQTDTHIWANRIMTGQLGTGLICLDVSSHLSPSSGRYSGMDTHAQSKHTHHNTLKYT